MNSIGTKEAGPQISIVDDSSDDDEAETDAILASLLAQLDNLESQQHESITFVHDQFQKQRQAVDALRKSVRDAESVIHQKRFSRQRAKIKRLKELKAAGTPRRHSAAPGVPSRFLLEALKENKSPPARKAVTSGKTEKTSGENKVAAAATPLLASGSTPTGMGVSRRQSVRFATDIEEILLVGESPVSDHDDVDIVMMGGDDDDDHPASASPLAPVAPPMETPESRRAGKKPETTETVVDTQGVEAAEKTTKVEKRSRPAKMRPTRGGGSRGRGGTMRGTISGRPRGGGAIRSISPRPSSHELEPIVTPHAPRSTAPTRGYGTARRAQPFKRGGATSRSSSSARGSDASEGTSALVPATKTSSMLDLPSRFIAVNTPGPSTLLDDWDLEGTPLSALPAGAGVARTGSSPLKPLPPPRSKGKAVESPRRNSKRLQTQDLPSRPFLFSSKDLRAIFGGGNPGSIIANVTPEGQRNAVVEYASYICLSLDAHFDPPGTMCDNAAILDVDGQEDPLDSQTVYPVWRKVGKAWLYCGDYTQGKREMVSVGAWKNSNEGVKKYWAKKVQDTEWGREFLVRKGLRGHGEIKNNSVADVLGYFEMGDDRKGLRLSATTLNFKTFNRSAYDRMVTKAKALNPAGLLLCPMGNLGPNNLSAKPRTSLLAAGDSESPKAIKTPTPLRERKRRRIEASPEEEEEETKVGTPVVPQRRPTSGNERARRTSRNEMNYRIPHLSEFSEEMETVKGKEKSEVIELSDAEDGGDDDRAQEEGEGGDDGEEGEGEDGEDGEDEGEEEGEGESGDEGEMVID